MKALLACAAGALIGLAHLNPVAAVNTPAAAAPTPKPAAPRIQLAILLDTSNSMDGLIDQARAELWKIVNQLAKARQGGRTAELEVALYEYGNSRISSQRGHTRRVLQFTTDLDRVSEELFTLRTCGGDEWPGHAMADASAELEWSHQDADLKVLYVAGNEPFGQGPVPWRESIAKLRAKGVWVGSIYCGQLTDTDATGWNQAAAIGKGSWAYIDQNKREAYRPAPQDAEIARLGIELNDTYVYYGSDGRVSFERQSAQDSNALGMGHGTAVSRALVKASSNYSNARWDLVDAQRDGRARASQLSDSELPEALRRMKPAERDAFVARQAARRAELAARISTLTAQRQAFLDSRDAASAKGTARSFDTVLVQGVLKLARDHGWSFE